MKEKGFTLVELLAVIVILAIVLIIAVPGVLSIINKTKDNAYDRQVDMIKEAARLYVTTDSDITWVGQETKTTAVSLDTLKMKGFLDHKIMDPKTKKELTCARTTITKTGSKYDYDVQLCDQVNANPRLSSNMIPIVYNGSTWVKADAGNQENNWFDYNKQQWANVATVTEETREAYKKAVIGTEVKMEDINTMFVWIPRFKYKLFNVDGSVSPVGNPNMAGDYMIDVQLEDVTTPKSKGNQNGQWLTHPAFTFGGEELSGFWFGKFQTAYLGDTTVDRNVIDPSKVIIKPNVTTWSRNKLANMYHNARGMQDQDNVFGLTSTDDPHLTKNMEWGAMTYLTYSNYGKAGNPNYTGADKEVRANNHTLILTGCGASSQDPIPSDICNSYETADGQAASTTGNITGIYDTAGGTWDYVAGVMKAANGSDLAVGDSGFDQTELNQIGREGKYLDIYEYGTSERDATRQFLGDATIEMRPYVNSTGSVWYKDDARVLAGNNPWFYRGGTYVYGNEQSTVLRALMGTTAHRDGPGEAYPNDGYRFSMR